MALLHTVSFLLMCAVFKSSLGRATDAAMNLGIAGGHKIKITDAPYMAGLFHNITQVCGGSIIHEKFILTSALCVQSVNHIQKVHVGSNHVDLHGTFIDVDEELCHENFGEVTAENDICLLKLRDSVPFSKTVARIRLADANVEVPAGAMVNVTGWGNKKSHGGDRLPIFLRQATVAVLSDDACRRIDHLMSSNMLCAGSKGRDACEGDAGGPLTENEVQVGIVSYKATARCGLLPSFYTKVSKYVNRITTTITNNS